MIVKAWMPRYNWGDQINKELVRILSGVTPELVHANQYQDQEHYLVVGSILVYCDPASIVWGSGFLDEHDKLINKPARICAVRGPLSRDMLLRQGVECPEIYGDPTMLLPRFYNPNKRKKHKYGMVLHWGDRDKAGSFTNPILPDLGTYEFIDRILECEMIVSSSLHGLIIAEAYGIPADQMALGPDHYQFKFDDYRESKMHLDLNALLEACPFYDEKPRG